MAAPRRGDEIETRKQTSENLLLNLNELMDKMIGHKKQRFSDVIVPRVGIPQAPKPPEEVRIQAVFESCTFKTAMSCVVGEL